MGKTSFGDIPGQVDTVQVALASIASNAASATYPICVARNAGKVAAAHLVFSTSRASGTKTDGLTLINLGTAGTGTTVLGTVKASAAYASYKGLAVSLASAPTFVAGETIGVAWASAAATTTVEACNVQLHLTY